MRSEPVLIIDRGDFPSLVACALQPAPDRVILFHLIEPDAAAPSRRAAVEAHARAWGVQRIVVARAVDLGLPGMAPPRPIFQSCLLLQAVVAGRQCGCRTIVWPELVGPDERELPAVVDRASAVTELANLDETTDTIGIDLPVVDLTADQAVELAEDTGATLGDFWPCDQAGPRPCGGCPGCLTWAAAFQAHGFPWPWLNGSAPEIIVGPASGLRV